MRRIKVAVDLQPVELGGTNGGAKLVALDIINGLCAEIAFVCFCRRSVFGDLRASLSKQVTLVPIPENGDLRASVGEAEADMDVGFDVLFFPFTNVSFLHPPARVVSIVHDLQFMDLRHNFSEVELREREDAIRSCLSRSTTVITISEFVRKTILRHFPQVSTKIVVIHNAMMNRLSTAKDAGNTIKTLGLSPLRYFLYPANFWGHKNHVGLLMGFFLYRKTYGTAAHKMILTGASTGANYEVIRDLASRYAPKDVILTGYVDEDVLSALFQRARAIVFPSLYEGFGIPLVEAMRFKRPLAASFVASIPEVVGDAAVFFDPRYPRQIAAALSEIGHNPRTQRELVSAGTKRLFELDDKKAMLRKYKTQFEKVFRADFEYDDYTGDVYDDGWISADAIFTCGSRQSGQELVIELAMGKAHPLRCARVTVESSSSARKDLIIHRSSRFIIKDQFPPAGGYVRITSDAGYIPRQLGINKDDRLISIKCSHVSVQHKDGNDELFMMNRGRRCIEQENGTIPIAALLRRQLAGSEPLAVLRILSNGTLSSCLIRLGCARASDVPRFIASLITPHGPRSLRVQREADGIYIVVPTLTHADMVVIRGEPGRFYPIDSIEVEVDAAASRVRNILSISQLVSGPKPYTKSARKCRPGFSVITPSFNQGAFIERTIHSVLKQRHIADYVIYDGCSTDSTEEVVKRCLHGFSFIREVDRGQADAVNKALEYGCGEIIAWINSDDTYADGAFEHVMEVFAERPDIDVVYGAGFHVDEHDEIIERYPTEDFRVSRLLETCFLCQPATFFRRSLLAQHGMLRESLHYSLDYELWVRFALGGARFFRTDRLLANSRLHDQTKTLSGQMKLQHEVNEMFEMAFGVVSKSWQDNFATLMINEHEIVAPGVDREIVFLRIRDLARRFWVNLGQVSRRDAVDRSAVDKLIENLCRASIAPLIGFDKEDLDTIRLLSLSG